ncbi:Zn-finger domain-containing protein (topoisomerase type I-like) [Methylophaga frappieri]|uniref:Zn-finger domain-containing protein (Topoisomerase type I-like) n=1 Tax=Methylophaga frappieri (strain ATCC BAA-2434 / DSM 25690 / JAM7) TaxID=754477 RepID=I1YIF3_METFJ|nr:NERD domain-containing protein [Methylophaga frappieri]AFJ02696.1 Zn-finger domain-containing protein (topoisomerase type I-like) [Methylophaga frappieri]
MDFSPIIQQVYGALWYLIPLAILAGVLKSPWFKGITGEFLVNTAARLFLPKDEYRLIKDVTLQTDDGTTQIDHIIVSRYGVFVIETKNMKGWIFGSANQKTWTQKIYKHTHKFQNPLHQNYKHVKTLETLLNIPASAIHSLVVFVGDSTFKTELPENVVYAGGYIRYIKARREVILSQAAVDTMTAQIEQLRLQRGFTTNRQHVKHLRQKKAPSPPAAPAVVPSVTASTTPQSQKQCPKCGGTMVPRTARKGQNAGNQFWGCATYPACRGVVKHP